MNLKINEVIEVIEVREITMAGSGYEDYSNIGDYFEYSPKTLYYNTEEFESFCIQNHIRLLNDKSVSAADLAKNVCQVEQMPFQDLDDETGYPPVAVGEFYISTNKTGQYSKNNGVNTPLQTTGVYKEELPDFLFTGAVNYHPDGYQSFVPVFWGETGSSRYYTMLLAPKCNKSDLCREDLRLLKIPCQFGVVISTGIWHQPPLVPQGSSFSFVTAQASTHCCVTKNFMEDYTIIKCNLL